MKSLSVRPSILCVQISTTTLPQASCKSGWCLWSSAMAPMQSTKASALLKSLSSYVLRRCWSRTDSQPGSSWRSSSAAPSGGTPPRQGTHCWSASNMVEKWRAARAMSITRRRSHPAELEPGGVRHPGRVPGWIPDDLDVDPPDAGNALHLAPDILLEHVAHAAPGRGHGHLDLDPVAALRQRHGLAVIDEAEVHEVDGDLRVEHRPQLLPDPLLIERAFACRGLHGGWPLAERVGVLVGDAEEGPLVRGHGELAAQRLRDRHSRAFGKHHLGPARDLGRLAVSRAHDGPDSSRGRLDDLHDRELARHGKGPHSVETVAPAPSSAERSVCQ